MGYVMSHILSAKMVPATFLPFSVIRTEKIVPVRSVQWERTTMDHVDLVRVSLD